jgi:hypothetical protein
MMSSIMSLTRRRWLVSASAAAVLRAAPREIPRNHVAEWTFEAAESHADPFNELTLDAVFTGPGGRTVTVPAFWAGGARWKARFASHDTGEWQFRTVCSDASDSGLHGRTGGVTVVPYPGANELLRRGPIRVAPSGRHFEHADGTPFFFLGDDWWLGLSSRLRYPAEFRTLAEDRVRKGYTVIKLTAGLNTDTAEFDARSANEGGQPWEPGYARIRPEFFDWADKRIALLVELGLHPSIVGSWGFYLKSMGVEKMNRHWRYCVARWGAYPVSWYLAMENDLPYYLSPTPAEDTQRAQREWTEVGRALRRTDGFRRPVSMQSWSTRESALGGLREPGLLDFDSLHMGHNDRDSAAQCIGVVRKLRARTPPMPVLPGEVVFEGIGWSNGQFTQRLCFWGSLLSGASGYCYGANGIWQFNRKDEPFGDSPHGRTWGGDAWDDAMRYPGSAQVGLGKKLLARYPFWRIEPHPEWVDPRPREAENLPPYCAGIPGELRLVYMLNSFARSLTVRDLEPGVKYRAFWFDPVSGRETRIGDVDPSPGGTWRLPVMPGVWDFVLVLERA